MYQEPIPLRTELKCRKCPKWGFGKNFAVEWSQTGNMQRSLNMFDAFHYCFGDQREKKNLMNPHDCNIFGSLTNLTWSFLKQAKAIQQCCCSVLRFHCISLLEWNPKILSNPKSTTFPGWVCMTLRMQSEKHKHISKSLTQVQAGREKQVPSAHTKRNETVAQTSCDVAHP